MSDTEYRKAEKETEAAQDRLKRFVKKASEFKNYHDPDRMQRVKEGREHEPQGMTWRELARELSYFQ